MTNTIALWVERSFKGEYVTIGQAAKEVGRSTRTLKRWKAGGKVQAPRNYTEAKGARINLYTPEDIDELRTYAKTTRPGRPRNAG